MTCPKSCQQSSFLTDTIFANLGDPKKNGLVSFGLTCPVSKKSFFCPSINENMTYQPNYLGLQLCRQGVRVQASMKVQIHWSLCSRLKKWGANVVHTHTFDKQIALTINQKMIILVNILLHLLFIFKLGTFLIALLRLPYQFQ